MFGSRLRELRQGLSLTQGQLAARAGVSRQLISAVEAGRHLPRVDAAAALADALSVSVEDLLRDDRETAFGVSEPPVEGASVRVARVGDRLVCVPARPEGEAWTSANGVVRDGAVELFSRLDPAAIIAGCDPAIGLVARLVEVSAGPALLPASTTSAAAAAALVGGRVHAAVVHGPEERLPIPEPGVRRIEMARWQVGLCAPPELPNTWAAEALAGRLAVIQRDPGAASQDAFERAADAAALAGASRATGHLDAAAWARRTGCAAVTMEPAAAAFGLAFHPLEEHVAQLWLPTDHLDVAGVRRFLDELTGPRLRRRLDAIGGYDLSRVGVEVAA